MLAYAARVPRHDERRSSPNAMLAIIAGHVALLAIVMSAKMELSQKLIDRPIDVTWIDPIDPPPPNPPVHHVTRPQPGPTVTDPLTAVPPSPGPIVTPNPPVPDPGPFVGSSPDPIRPHGRSRPPSVSGLSSSRPRPSCARPIRRPSSPAARRASSSCA